LIADLDSNQFPVRDKATQELEKLAELAHPALKKALAGNPSLEMRQRIETLLDGWPKWSPGKLRTLRAITVLEQTGTPEAKQLLERLAQGVPEALLTQEAKGSCERLARRSSPQR
jgi:hypothetical protein